jgi:hypothetical protein
MRRMLSHGGVSYGNWPTARMSTDFRRHAGLVRYALFMEAELTERGLVHFIHGKESGPHGSKIVALSEVAGERGWEVSSLDYSHTTDPTARLDSWAHVRANTDR